ncbi:MAG: hypothetical protein EOP34_03355 [Rickettsiales bacterium]|nr:MAG: hypothetical protein EOP34_03355 [Rickettsiales bacterium]
MEDEADEYYDTVEEEGSIMSSEYDRNVKKSVNYDKTFERKQGENTETQHLEIEENEEDKEEDLKLRKHEEEEEGEGEEKEEEDDNFYEIEFEEVVGEENREDEELQSQNKIQPFETPFYVDKDAILLEKFNDREISQPEKDFFDYIINNKTSENNIDVPIMYKSWMDMKHAITMDWKQNYAKWYIILLRDSTDFILLDLKFRFEINVSSKNKCALCGHDVSKDRFAYTLFNYYYKIPASFVYGHTNCHPMIVGLFFFFKFDKLIKKIVEDGNDEKYFRYLFSLYQDIYSMLLNNISDIRMIRNVQ